MKKQNIKYYNSYEDDFVTIKNQDYQIDDSYVYIHNNPFYKVFSFFIYVIFYIVGLVYLKLIKRIKFKNKKILKTYKGCYIYANHTQMVADPFMFSVLAFPNMPYIVIDSANLKLPVLGKLLPFLGAIPIPGNIHKMKDFIDTLYYYNSKGKNIVIFPEAHLWPYCSFIREFPNTSFRFPVECNSPVFTMTTTYQESKFFKKPKITVYFDGPFFPDEGETKKEKTKILHDKVYNSMMESAKNSNYEYIKYLKKD